MKARGNCALLLGMCLWMVHINGYASSALEPYYLQRGSANSGAPADTATVDSIDSFTGAVQLSQTDLYAPGEGGMGIAITRHYRSLGRPRSDVNFRGERSPNGIGWIMHFGRVISPNGSPSCNASQGDNLSRNNSVWESREGSAQALLPALSTWEHDLITKGMWVADCISGGYVVISPDGTRYTADHYVSKDDKVFYYVTRIESKAGHYITIEYGASGNSSSGNNSVANALSLDASATGHRDLLRKVSAFSSGSSGAVNVVEFKYRDVNSWDARLDNIYHQGRNLVQYTYKKQLGRDYLLIGATLNNSGNANMAWKYGYEESQRNGYLSLIDYESPGGTRVEFNYQSVDFRTGSTSLFETMAVDTRTLTSTGGVQGSGVWSYSFDQTITRDRTVVSLPGGDRIEYEHTGSDNYPSGKIWEVGSLKEVRFYDGTSLTKKELYSWENGSELSSQDEYHLYKATDRNNSHWSKRLTLHTITLDGTNYSTTYSGFDGFNNPGRVVETGNESRTTDISYYNNKTDWIINVKGDEKVSGDGDILRTFYSSGSLAGNLKTESVFGAKTTYTYHTVGTSSGMLKTVDGPLFGDTISYFYYEHGIPKREEHPESTSIIRDVNRYSGDVKSVKDQRGRTVGYQYDRFHIVTDILTARSDDSNISVFPSYTSSGKSVRVSRGGFSETSKFDGAGRLVLVTKSASGESSIFKKYTYDVRGRMIYESDDYFTASSRKGRAFEYDVLGRIKSVRYDADGFTVSYDYQTGNVTKVSRSGTTSVYNTYRSYGNPNEKHLVGISKTGTSNNTSVTIKTTIGRDKYGYITSVKQGDKTRTYKLDSYKNLDYVDNPETGRTELTYDLAGNLKDSKVGGSGVTHYKYDRLNRLVKIDYPDDPNSGTVDVIFGYYPDGKLKYTEKNDSSSGGNRWDYDYDKNNNLEYEQLSIDGSIYLFDYEYNALDAVKGLHYPKISQNPLFIDYAPDGFGRPSKASDYVTDVGYHANGAVDYTEYGNGFRNTFTLDGRQHPDLWQSLRGGSVAMEYDYEFSRLGNLDNISGDSVTRSFEYDSFNRLTHMNGSSIVSYDELGNITHKALAGKTISYNYDGATNKLSGVTGSVSSGFSYDSYGNMTNNIDNTFLFDDASNLIRVNGTGYTKYDGHNRRLRKEHSTSTGHEFSYSIYTNDGKLRLEIDANGDSKENVYVADQLVASRKLEGREPPAGTVPDAPVLISAVLNGEGLHVQWNTVDASPEVAYYNVRIKEPTMRFYYWNIVFGADTDSFIHTLYADYPWKLDIYVEAVNSAGTSLGSNEIEVEGVVEEPPGPPEPPEITHVTPSLAGHNGVTLNFSGGGAPSISHYVIRYRRNSASRSLYTSASTTPYQELIVEGGDTTSVFLSDVGATPYTVYMTAVNEFGESGQTPTYQPDLITGELVVADDENDSSADLETTMRSVAKWNSTAKNYKYAVDVINHGVDAADDVTLTLTYPDDGTLLVTNIVPGQGSCDSSGDECSLGTLAVDQKVSVEITVTKDQKGDKNHGAGVTSSAVDPDDSNNFASGKFGGSLGWLLILAMSSLVTRRIVMPSSRGSLS